MLKKNMKKILLLTFCIFVITNFVNAQNKITYAEIYKLQNGWTAVISGNIVNNTNNQIYSDIIPKMSERLYILPSSGKLFDTHIYALNYISKLGFKVVEVYQMNGNTCFLMETDKIITITVTNDWTTKKNIIINK
jgi:hypothetical protein